MLLHTTGLVVPGFQIKLWIQEKEGEIYLATAKSNFWKGHFPTGMPRNSFLREGKYDMRNPLVALEKKESLLASRLSRSCLSTLARSFTPRDSLDRGFSLFFLLWDFYCKDMSKIHPAKEVLFALLPDVLGSSPRVCSYETKRKGDKAYRDLRLAPGCMPYVFLALRGAGEDLCTPAIEAASLMSVFALQQM